MSQTLRWEVLSNSGSRGGATLRNLCFELLEGLGTPLKRVTGPSDFAAFEVALAPVEELWPGQREQVSAEFLLQEFFIHEIRQNGSPEFEVSICIRPLDAPLLVHQPWSSRSWPSKTSHPPAPIERWLESYRRSRLYQFHRHFYSQEPYPESRWQETYATIPARAFPDCVARLLQEGGCLLHHWESIQLLLRSLLLMGWHPRHLSGVLLSLWARERLVFPFNSLVSADHFARCLAGWLMLGGDSLQRFDCASVRALGNCPPAPCCPVNLEDLGRRAEDTTFLGPGFRDPE